MKLFDILAFLVLSSTTEASSCPSYGKYGFRCASYYYCNKSMGLVCGNGVCGGKCPDGWINYRDESCLSPVNLNVTFSQAVESCKSRDAVLATMPTQDKLQFVKGILNKTMKNSTEPIWTGMIMKSGMNFIWPDGTRVYYNDTNWLPAQPNGFKNQKFINLGFLSSVNDWRYNDIEAYRHYSYICEIVIEKCSQSICQCDPKSYYDDSIGTCVQFKMYKEPCKITSQCDQSAGLVCINGRCACKDNDTQWYNDDSECRKCPFEWVYLGDSCYHFMKAAKNYSDAFYYCKGYNTNLAKFNTTAKLDAIKQFYIDFVGIDKLSWIGAHSFNSTHIYWHDREMLQLPSSLWCKNISSVNSTGCVHLSNHIGFELCLNFSANCNATMYQVCELSKFHGSNP